MTKTTHGLFTARSTQGVRVTTLVVVLMLFFSLPIFADSLTLTQCVDQALANGPDIRASRAARGSAQATYDAAAAANSFSLSGTGGVSHSEAGTTRSNGTIAGSPYDTADAGVAASAPLSSTLSASVSQTLLEDSALDQSTTLHLGASTTLWDGYPRGSGSATVQQASLALQVTQSSEDANQKTIVYQVKQAYYTLLAQQRQIDILKKSLAQRVEELRKTQALYDAQSASQIDLRQAQINRTQADLDLQKAQDTLGIDRELLSAVVGWPLDRQYDVAEVGDVAVPTMDVAEAVKKALAQRSELKQSALNIASADISVARAKAQGALVVKANGSVDFNMSWASPVSTSTGWGAALTLSLPILDAGATAAAVQQAQLQNQALKIQQDKLVASISTGVKNAVSSLRDLRARADLAQASMELAQSQDDLAQLRFANGVLSNLDVLTASVALTTAQVNLANAKSDAQLAALALDAALGN